MFAGEVEAKVHGCRTLEIDFVIYNALRKAFPQWPTITSRGDISINRQTESTTHDMLMQTIEEMGMADTWQEFEKLRAYVEYVEESGDEQFIVRNNVHRNRHEIFSCGERVFMETKDMLNVLVSTRILLGTGVAYVVYSERHVLLRTMALNGIGCWTSNSR